jgi:hypothetical protein
MTTTTSRRAVLAGTATALAAGAAVNLAAIVAAKADTRAQVGDEIADPIFAAIGRHRRTLQHRLETQRAMVLIQDEIEAGDEAAAEVVWREAVDVDEAAATDLAELTPTSFAGIDALLAHVIGIATGRVFLPADPKNWQSGAWCLPEFRNPADGHNLYAFDIMQSVRTALAGLRVAS